MNPKLNKETVAKANKAIGERIAKIRKEKGLTQADLAFKCNTSSTKIGETECGKYDLRLQTIMAIANGLETGIKNILPIEILESLKSDIWIE